MIIVVFRLPKWKLKQQKKIKLYALDNTPVDNLDNQCSKWATEDDRKKYEIADTTTRVFVLLRIIPDIFFLLSLGSMQFRNAMGHILE